MEQNTTQHFDNRREVIRDCLEAFYIRLRRERPASKDFEREVILAEKDFEKIQTNNLRTFFALVYNAHEGKFMPSNKQMLEYWQASKKEEARNYIPQDCWQCRGSGWVSGTKETKQGLRSYAFRCGCENGKRLSQTIRVWDKKCEESGFKRVR